MWPRDRVAGLPPEEQTREQGPRSKKYIAAVKNMIPNNYKKRIKQNNKLNKLKKGKSEGLEKSHSTQSLTERQEQE